MILPKSCPDSLHRLSEQLLFFPLMLLQMQIFFPRSHAAPYVALRFIHIQNDAGLGRQARVDLRKAFCYVFMYGYH